MLVGLFVSGLGSESSEPRQVPHFQETGNLYLYRFSFSRALIRINSCVLGACFSKDVGVGILAQSEIRRTIFNRIPRSLGEEPKGTRNYDILVMLTFSRQILPIDRSLDHQNVLKITNQKNIGFLEYNNAKNHSYFIHNVRVFCFSQTIVFRERNLILSCYLSILYRPIVFLSMGKFSSENPNILLVSIFHAIG